MTMLSSHHPKYRTKLCRHIVSGSCPYDQKCSFIHPPQPINPFSSSLAQYIMNYNVLLPQLIALSNQQAAVKEMQRRLSPPGQQGPQLVDEPSPTTSLLLSASDHTSPDQAPQRRRSKRRQQNSCRYVVRTGGSCPVGTQCRFQHDVATPPIGAARKGEQVSLLGSVDDRRDHVKTISGGVLMTMQSPMVTGQARLELFQQTEAEQPQPSPSLQQIALNAAVRNGQQPMYWPGYLYHPYYATVPATDTVPVSAPVDPNVYQPAPATAQNEGAPPAEAETGLPAGAYQVNGTTYFPTQTPCVPADAPVPYPIPIPPTPYARPIGPSYPYYVIAATPRPASHYDPSMGIPRTCFDPFSTNLTTSPVVPQLEDYPIASFSSPSEPIVTENLGPTNVAHINEEFPYEPPKNQRVGHARRISVNIKKHTRGNSYSG